MTRIELKNGFYIDWIRICCSLNPGSPNKDKSILRGIQVLYGEQR